MLSNILLYMGADSVRVILESVAYILVINREL